MKYILYLTINTKNNKIYIGYHKTNTPYTFDGYLGCGIIVSRPSTYKHSKTAFQFAVNKYGPKSFKRFTLAVVDTLEEVKTLETLIVNESFIKRKDVYNMTIGGGETPKGDIEIFQYDYNGNFIKSWPSAVAAGEYFNVASNNIRNSIRSKNTACGYLWSEEYVEKLDISTYKLHYPHDCVYKFDKDGNLIATYENVELAAKSADSVCRLIFSAIAGKTKSKGFYYSYDPEFKPQNDTYNKLKDIYLYDLDGSFYAHFDSPRDCANYFNDTKTSRLYAAVRTGGLYHNYQISKVKVPFMKQLKCTNTPRQVLQFDLEGNFIKEWDSIESASKEYGSGVKKCLKGLMNKTKGFVFKFKN